MKNVFKPGDVVELDVYKGIEIPFKLKVQITLVAILGVFVFHLLKKIDPVKVESETYIIIKKESPEEKRTLIPVKEINPKEEKTEPITKPKKIVKKAVPLSVSIKPDAKQIKYINRFLKTAIEEEVKFGIPATITLAQGVVESESGTSNLSNKETNNHFGIKCFSRRCSKGHCRNRYDDHHKDFFRIYSGAWHSYRDHSKFLAGGKRYKDLFKLEISDYEGWAKGLKKAGYATHKDYASLLIKVIERNNIPELVNNYKIKQQKLASSK